MTLEIGLVLGILSISIILFVSEKVRMDLIALLVLVSLAVFGLVTPSEALSGFSNPAVITIWAMFILSGALTRTGLANRAGQHVLRLAKNSQLRLILLIMLVSGLMSAFMNNVGVAALLLPVVMDISRRTDYPPSKMLIPLAFGTLLGGIITLIGTPSNILLSDILKEYGLQPFYMFDYAPLGLAALLVGILFMALGGHRLLPTRRPARDFISGKPVDMRNAYELQDRMFTIYIPDESELSGKTLAESKLGSILGLNVIGILHNGHRTLAPGPDAVLKSGDRLLVEGRPDTLGQLSETKNLILLEDKLNINELVSKEVNLVEVCLSETSELTGLSLGQSKFRSHYKVNVLAIWRQNKLVRTNLQNITLKTDDRLLVQGAKDQIDDLRKDSGFVVSTPESAEIYKMHERLLLIKVPQDSILVGKSLEECHLGDAYGFMVLAITREGETRMMLSPREKLMAGDVLLAEGKPRDFKTLRGLQNLEIEEESVPTLEKLETSKIGLEEIVLSPHSSLAGKTLRQIHFREKYGLSVLAIWSGGRAYRSHLRDKKLQFGDALLLYGPREKLKLLSSEPDFLILTERSQEPPLIKKAPLAGLIMLAALLPAIFGWLPVSISSVMGAALMVLTGCLNMNEAYRYIEWQAVFLIAGMLPLGIAMQNSGAAELIAESISALVGPMSSYAAISVIYIIANLATQILPNPVVAVLMAPIALNTAEYLGISPYAVIMVLAVAVSVSLMTPVAHSSNAIVMGPGGYRFIDYLKVGLPLSLLVLCVTLLLLPLFWPV